MPLPANFSDAQHLANVIRRLQNKKIARKFRDLGDESWTRSIDTPRGEERTACTIMANDSGVMIVQRLLLYYFVLGYGRDIFETIFYAIPNLSFHISFKFLPQVILNFKESRSDAKLHNRQPLDAQLSFRYMDKNVTKAELEALALKIKNEFATPRIILAKGKNKYSYKDRENGYEFVISATTEADAKDLITRALRLQNHIPDWEFFTTSTPDVAPTGTKTEVFLGEVITLPDKRPICNVRFTNAEFARWGLKKPIPLVDTTGKYPNALEFINPV